MPLSRDMPGAQAVAWVRELDLARDTVCQHRVPHAPFYPLGAEVPAGEEAERWGGGLFAVPAQLLHRRSASGDVTPEAIRRNPPPRCVLATLLHRAVTSAATTLARDPSPVHLARDAWSRLVYGDTTDRPALEADLYAALGAGRYRRVARMVRADADDRGLDDDTLLGSKLVVTFADGRAIASIPGTVSEVDLRASGGVAEHLRAERAREGTAEGRSPLGVDLLQRLRLSSRAHALLTWTAWGSTDEGPSEPRFTLGHHATQAAGMGVLLTRPAWAPWWLFPLAAYTLPAWPPVNLFDAHRAGLVVLAHEADAIFRDPAPSTLARVYALHECLRQMALAYYRANALGLVELALARGAGVVEFNGEGPW